MNKKKLKVCWRAAEGSGVERACGGGGLTRCHGWLKASCMREEREPLFVGLNAVNSIRERG